MPLLHLSDYEPKSAYRRRDGRARLRTHWRSTLTFDCPHCDDVHDVCVREVYLKACVDSLHPSG
jgi:hypothetical protein